MVDKSYTRKNSKYSTSFTRKQSRHLVNIKKRDLVHEGYVRRMSSPLVCKIVRFTPEQQKEIDKLFTPRLTAEERWQLYMNSE